MKRVLSLAAALAVMVGVAACGSSSSSSSATSASASNAAATSGTASSQAAAGSCGTIPQQMPADPDGVLAKLPASVQGAYNLYPQAVHASAWSQWKPRHGPPYTVYFSPGNTDTPFIQEMLATFNSLKANSSVIGKVITQDSGNQLQTQIQQLQQAIREKVDLIITLPLSPVAEATVLEAAGKAGIPVITPLNAAANPYVVGLDGNVILEGAKLAQGLVSAIGEKGNILDVHGIPGVPSDFQVFQGAADVLKNCPNVKTIGSVTGQFIPAVAKSATLEFLASHPQPIAGAIQPGGMATGIIQAFMQTGRTVPSVADQGATPGALAYWEQHKGSYKGVAVPIPPVTVGNATWNLALGLLAGRGIRITDILDSPVVITDANLSQWVQPGWSLSTALAFAPTPASVPYYSSAYLSQFFSKPGSGS